MATLSDVHRQQTSLEASLHQRMSEFEEQLKRSSEPSSLSRLYEDYKAFKENVCGILQMLRTQINELSRATDVLEMRHRRKCLLFGGIAEVPKEDSSSLICRVLEDQLHIKDVVPASFKACHRLGRLADEDDELSEVQPDAVPPEVREWLASTFTRQLATAKRKSDEKPKFRSVAHAIRAGIFVDRIYRRVTSTALMQFPQDVVRVLKTLDEWSFDVFALHEASCGAPVKYLGYELLNRYGMIHKFKVPPTILENFLSRIEEGYCKFHNPYHNNLHAADVSQTVHYMLCQTGLMNWLSDLEIFATLVAAVVHDFEHTGTTNNFHVMSGSDTALLYNDRAVLENHHISAAFRLMRDEDCNILQNLSRDEFREFRTLVIDMVLATDMSFHFQQLKNMRSLLTLAEPTVDKSKAASLVLHCCDISHPAKRWDLHHRWTMSLLDEFFLQGDKERDLGLPFSPLCDRNNTLVAESQIGFIEFIVEPSMGVCADMLECVLGPLHSNTKNSTSTSHEPINEENTVIEPSPKFKIRKPWIACLSDNKKIWKEQAAKDAEARAKQEEESNNPPPPTEE
ncbi:hypothetical protein ABMA27_013560 [Loxostege sticticalis]|uniref:Phosphodiesterase n=1 Tax=Loxostege sticticalis TaxID=481309 RepID=A0ABR3IFS3_LOXSC